MLCAGRILVQLGIACSLSLDRAGHETAKKYLCSVRKTPSGMIIDTNAIAVSKCQSCPRDQPSTPDAPSAAGLVPTTGERQTNEQVVPTQRNWKIANDDRRNAEASMR